ncbi:MAG: class I SAM-dependent methyltransferase [Anaerolineae bacterium]
MFNNIIRRTLKFIAPPLVWLFAPLFYYVARSGTGMTLCRKWGFEPMLLHYYQPLPDYEKLPESFYTTPQDLPGIRLEPTAIESTLKHLSAFAGECQWPEQASKDGDYYAQNPAFGYSSAALLHTMIRAHNSRRVLEIGSGFSTLISLEALRKNGDFTLTCIEPYPKAWLRQLALDLHVAKAEDVDLNLYTSLNAGDILFIDSSHVAKLNSDVNFTCACCRALPGVIVHIHDICYPVRVSARAFHQKAVVLAGTNSMCCKRSAAATVTLNCCCPAIMRRRRCRPRSKVLSQLWSAATPRDIKFLDAANASRCILVDDGLNHLKTLHPDLEPLPQKPHG